MLDAYIIFVMTYRVFDFETIFMNHMRRHQVIQTRFFEFRIFDIIFKHERNDNFDDDIYIVIRDFVQKMIDNQ